MTDEAARYARVTSLVGGAQGLRGARLEAYLDECCGADARLRAEVAEVLAHAADDDTSAPFAEQGLESGRRALDVLVDDAAAPWCPERIGEYTILRQLGRGGMGVVYEARQESPSRRVAIKLLHPMQATPERLRRFRHEAELLGRLQHPGIAQIFEAGSYDSGRGVQPFFAMELVDGIDLLTHCEREQVDLAGRMELLARVADAVQYAHERGVIHRDLKPDNVLVSASGQPRILDFGVARASGSSTLLSTLQTAEGQLVGTLGYMAPELLIGTEEAVTPQVDVYALGVLGFELLVGRPPHEIQDLSIPQAIALLATSGTPRASLLAPRLHGDVDTILGKALESDRGRRYATPAAFAADLRRYLGHRPILARPPSRIYRLDKFTRRHTALVGGVLATIAVAVVAVGFAIDATRRARELERAGYVSGLALAHGALAQQDHVGAAGYLDRLPAQHRGWEYDYLRARSTNHIDEHDVPARLVERPVFDAEGRRMFGVMADASVGIWDVATGRLLHRAPLDVDLAERAPETLSAVLHGPGLSFAVAWGNEIVVGDLETGWRRVGIPSPNGAEVSCLSWSADGRRLLFRADGLWLWDEETDRILPGPPRGIGGLGPAGLRIVSSGASFGHLELTDAESGARLARCSLDDAITDIAFSPDGELLALAGYYKNAHVLDARTLGVVARLTGHMGIVYSVTWSPDGARLATTSEDGTARVWQAPRFDTATVYNTSLETASTAAFLPAGDRVVVAGDRVRGFPVDDPSVLRGHDSYVYRLSFSLDGSRLASAAYLGAEVLVWDVHAGRLVSRHPAPRTFSGGVGIGAPFVDFSADGRRLVVSTGVTMQWNLETGDAVPVPEEGGWLARHTGAAGRSGDVRLTHNAEALSADASRLAVCRGAVVDLYDRGFEPRIDVARPEGGTPGSHAIEVGTLPCGRLVGHVGKVHAAAFSRDGSRVATGGEDTTVRIWDARTGEQLLVLRGHTQYVMDVQFSPDGTLLASASGDTTIRLWDTKPLHERRRMGDR